MTRRAAVIAFLMTLFLGRSALADCVAGSDYQLVPLIIKRSNKNIVLKVPKSFEMILLPSADSFIINFSYPDFRPRAVDEKITTPSARIVISGANQSAQSAADWFISKHPANPPFMSSDC